MCERWPCLAEQENATKSVHLPVSTPWVIRSVAGIMRCQDSDNTQIYSSRAPGSRSVATSRLLDTFPWMPNRLLKLTMHNRELGSPLPSPPPRLPP